MTETHSPIPTIQRKDTPPPGLIPKNTQVWVIGGLALLMVLIIAFSGSREVKEQSRSSQPLPRTTMDPDQARIQDYRTRIDEQARKLQAEQAQLIQAREALGIAGGPALPPRGSVESIPRPPGSRADGIPVRDGTIDVEHEKLEYQSLFASNVALSLRTEGTNVSPTEKSSPKAGPSLAPSDSRTAQAGKAGETQEKSNDQGRAKAETLSLSEGKKYRLFEGTIIETVLTNRLDGSFSGPVNCLVTTNVYSHNGQQLLVPQGSRALGEAKRVETSGQERLAVVFHRLIMPDGFAISLDQLHGLNQIGETGLRDQISHHYLQVFGVSIALGAIAGLSQANTQYGANTTPEDAYRQGVASSVSQSSIRILDRYLNILPTFTIREGHRVKVYLSEDLLLPAYEKHQMPGDL